MTLTPLQIPAPSSGSPGNATPDPATPHISHTGRPTTSPYRSQTEWAPVPPWREVYKSRGAVDPNYVFSKPPRPEWLRRRSEKGSKKQKEHKPHYPLCTSPGATPPRSPAREHSTPVVSDIASV